MKKHLFVLFSMVLFVSQIVLAADSDKCGPKPFAKAGCHIGECVAGKWEMICDIKPTDDCGAKPAPKEGCRIGKCVNKHWEEICTGGTGGDMAQ